jgi:hypothetical protein
MTSKDVYGLSAYMAPNSSFLEIVASRVYYTINGCLWAEEENFVVMFLRPIGWGLRGAMYLFSVIFLFMSLEQEKNPVFMYGFSRERDEEGVLQDDSSDMFEWFVYLVYSIWITSILTEVLSYLVGRYEQTGKSKEFTHFPFIFCNRASLRDSGWLWLLSVTVWFLGLGAAASIVMHTVVAHGYVKRNNVVLWMMVALTACSAAGTLADALSLGGPTGIRAQSHAASWLSALRVVVILPLQIIFSGFFVWLCCPPTGMLLDCVLCNSDA